MYAIVGIRAASYVLMVIAGYGGTPERQTLVIIPVCVCTHTARIDSVRPDTVAPHLNAYYIMYHADSQYLYNRTHCPRGSQTAGRSCHNRVLWRVNV